MVDRYFFSIYPLLLLFALAVFLCVGRIWKVKAGFVWGIAGVYLCVTFFLYGKGDIQYLYPGYDEALRQMQTEYSDAPALYVTKGNHLIANNCLFLAQQKRSMPATTPANTVVAKSMVDFHFFLHKFQITAVPVAKKASIQK